MRPLVFSAAAFLATAYLTGVMYNGHELIHQNIIDFFGWGVDLLANWIFGESSSLGGYPYHDLVPIFMALLAATFIWYVQIGGRDGLVRR